MVWATDNGEGKLTPDGKTQCHKDTDPLHHSSCICKDLSFKGTTPSAGETKLGQA